MDNHAPLPIKKIKPLKLQGILRSKPLKKQGILQSQISCFIKMWKNVKLTVKVIRNLMKN